MNKFYPGKNICVIVIAYNAEKTIKSLIDEIPRDYVNTIIVGDDNSTDKTFQIINDIEKIIVHKNDSNKGMGGNLKVLFEIAIKSKSDFIIQLHGDNQYDATKIPLFLDKMINQNFDMVLGSRILGGNSLNGGMPIYKYYGNKLLNYIQNSVYGLELSDYATGYKSYKTNVLKKVAYNKNRDDFIFDEQINTQFAFFTRKISMVGIPTRYFKEASSVGFFTSIHYGVLTLVTLIEYVLAKKKMFTFAYLRKK